jgi:hypothetical protein
MEKPITPTITIIGGDRVDRHVEAREIREGAGDGGVQQVTHEGVSTTVELTDAGMKGVHGVRGGFVRPA